jgi:Family of unknown function (DUF5397)
MATKSTGDAEVLGSYRRFGEAGPVYKVVNVSVHEGYGTADVQVQETGEVAQLALEHVLTDPKA